MKPEEVPEIIIPQVEELLDKVLDSSDVVKFARKDLRVVLVNMFLKGENKGAKDAIDIVKGCSKGPK